MVTKSNSASLSAVKADVLGTDIAFDFDGDSYTVPPTSDWDLDVLEAIEDGKMIGAVRSLLGVSQWATFKAKRRTASDAAALYEALQGALGLGN